VTATLRWTLIIVGLLVANALAMGFLVMASSTSPPRVIPDYYAKAAAYDTQIDQAATNRALGWRVEVQPGLAIDLRDRDGAPIDDARVRVVITPRAQLTGTALELVAAGGGRYAVAHEARGLETLAIVVERGGERFTARATLIE
jgi:nitrogen fixation protein FixH